MPGTQEITRRLKSIKNTKKITRAMQMVSAAKMRKAQTATIASRDYASLAFDLVHALGSQTSRHPLLQEFPLATKVGIIVISTNRGLVGSFNTNLLNAVRKYTTSKPDVICELVVMGKKAVQGSKRMQFHVAAEFHKYDTTIAVEEVYPIASLITEQFKTGQYKEILIVYNHFVSTLTQTPTIKQLLPFSANAKENSNAEPDILLEPDPTVIINQLIPRIIESQLYQAILESDASEHSARMVMMKNATEAAADLISDLTLTYNQLRQNKITTELSEITAGKIALENQ